MSGGGGGANESNKTELETKEKNAQQGNPTPNYYPLGGSAAAKESNDSNAGAAENGEKDAQNDQNSAQLQKKLEELANLKKFGTGDNTPKSYRDKFNKVQDLGDGSYSWGDEPLPQNDENSVNNGLKIIKDDSTAGNGGFNKGSANGGGGSTKMRIEDMRIQQGEHNDTIASHRANPRLKLDINPERITAANLSALDPDVQIPAHIAARIEEQIRLATYAESLGFRKGSSAISLLLEKYEKSLIRPVLAKACNTAWSQIWEQEEGQKALFHFLQNGTLPAQFAAHNPPKVAEFAAKIQRVMRTSTDGEQMEDFNCVRPKTPRAVETLLDVVARHNALIAAVDESKILI